MLGSIAAFASHEHVRHSAGEHGRGPVRTNTIKGCFSIFKRGMKGVCRHCSERRLHRHAFRFESRYDNRIGNGPEDVARAVIVLKGAVGRRLLYRDSSSG